MIATEMEAELPERIDTITSCMCIYTCMNQAVVAELLRMPSLAFGTDVTALCFTTPTAWRLVLSLLLITAWQARTVITCT